MKCCNVQCKGHASGGPGCGLVLMVWMMWLYLSIGHPAFGSWWAKVLRDLWSQW